jgi:predicted pyridoxine 5'-phosphate oxidase superfamily flavin-nucleotide-binding protein
MRFRAHPAMLRKEARVMVPDKYLDLLQQKKAFANLATVNPDGSPQVTPVWFDYTDGLVRVRTPRGAASRHAT